MNALCESALLLSDPRILLLCVFCRYSHRQRSYRHVPAEAHGLQREKPRLEEPQSSASHSPGHLCLNRLGLGGLSFTRATSSLVLLQADAGLERPHVRGFRRQSALYFHFTFTFSPRQLNIVNRSCPFQTTLPSPPAQAQTLQVRLKFRTNRQASS